MRVLVVTKLFPNAVEPLASIYNREQYGALGKLCDVEVLGLIPAFPGARLLEVGEGGLRETAWEDLDLVWHWRRFLTTPEAYLRHLTD